MSGCFIKGMGHRWVFDTFPALVQGPFFYSLTLDTGFVSCILRMIAFQSAAFKALEPSNKLESVGGRALQEYTQCKPRPFLIA